MALASSNATRMIFVSVTVSLLSGTIASDINCADPRSTAAMIRSIGNDLEIGNFIPWDNLVFS